MRIKPSIFYKTTELDKKKANQSHSENSDLTNVRWTSMWVQYNAREVVTTRLYMRGDDCQLMVDVIILPTKVRNLQNERWRAMKHAEFSAYMMGTTILVTGTGVFAAVVVLEVGILSFVAVTA
ncbi:hypothetical protein Tco_0949754 [Tanacetum coccineum]